VWANLLEKEERSGRVHACQSLKLKGIDDVKRIELGISWDSCKHRLAKGIFWVKMLFGHCSFTYTLLTQTHFSLALIIIQYFFVKKINYHTIFLLIMWQHLPSISIFKTLLFEEIKKKLLYRKWSIHYFDEYLIITGYAWEGTFRN
jgi:hypothetical protein